MNHFYVPVAHVEEHSFTLTGQEARHAAQVLRYKQGDEITAVDGQGTMYFGTIRSITKSRVEAVVKDTRHVALPEPKLMMALGLIKKRQRLEFAIEKLVELGISEIILFKSEHSERDKIRMDRLQGKAISAMKQSLRAWMPDITLYNSLHEVMEFYGDMPLVVAHEKVTQAKPVIDLKKGNESLLLMVGPEGGFSESEIKLARRYNATMFSLGAYRLRTETAALCMASMFRNNT